ncbi:MAG TPA: LLM class flavin-dependent oxidoreductase [Atopostipes sp.]|nr:LLM class flavin-dependent oxidoreductase [Atopostipes sp.]
MNTNPLLPTFNTENGIEFGIYTLGDHLPNPDTGQIIPASQRIEEIIELAKFSEELGFDFFQLGESHQEYFVSQAHLIILAAIARETKKIKLSTGVTTISVLDPVRVFEDAATIDLMSGGRMEIVAGRASRIGSFELFGYDHRDYDELFEEKFELLLEINQNEIVNWTGNFRSELKDAQILPRPENEKKGIPIWRGVGNSPSSAIKAGQLGVPLFQAHLAGAAQTYQNRIQKYKEAGYEAGFTDEELPVGTGGILLLAESTEEAFKRGYPYFNAGFQLTNGQDFPKRAFAQGKSPKSVTLIGSPELVIEKMKLQYDLYKQQRFAVEADFGGMPIEEVKQTLMVYKNEVLPEVIEYIKEDKNKQI